MTPSLQAQQEKDNLLSQCTLLEAAMSYQKGVINHLAFGRMGTLSTDSFIQVK